MDFWSYAAKAQQAVKVRVTVSAPCSPLADPDPIRTEPGPRAKWLHGADGGREHESIPKLHHIRVIFNFRQIGLN